MRSKPQLSVLVLARDEAARLPAFFAALGQLRLPYEVVVLENGSRDATAALARKAGARVFKVKWRGYAKTKNAGIAKCRSGWVLSLDADERPDAVLAAAVEAMALDRGGGERGRVAWLGELNRLNYFLGRPMRHGGWHPDWHLRLFRKGHARFEERLVHEGMRPAEPGERVERLPGLLHHHSYPDLRGYVDRLNRYSSLQADELMQAKGPRPAAALLRSLADPPLTFLKMYVLRLGLLDGQRGLALAVLSASSTFWKYAKWWHRSWKAVGGRAGEPWVLNGPHERG